MLFDLNGQHERIIRISSQEADCVISPVVTPSHNLWTLNYSPIWKGSSSHSEVGLMKINTSFLIWGFPKFLVNLGV